MAAAQGADSDSNRSNRQPWMEDDKHAPCWWAHFLSMSTISWDDGDDDDDDDHDDHDDGAGDYDDEGKQNQ